MSTLAQRLQALLMPTRLPDPESGRTNAAEVLEDQQKLLHIDRAIANIEAGLKGLTYTERPGHEKECRVMYVDLGHPCVCGAAKIDEAIDRIEAAIEHYCGDNLKKEVLS